MTFTKGSSTLTANDERVLARLDRKLVDGAVVNVTFFAKGHQRLGARRAAAVKAFLLRRHPDPIHVTVSVVKGKFANAVRVAPKKN